MSLVFSKNIDLFFLISHSLTLYLSLLPYYYYFDPIIFASAKILNLLSPAPWALSSHITRLHNHFYFAISHLSLTQNQSINQLIEIMNSNGKSHPRLWVSFWLYGRGLDVGVIGEWRKKEEKLELMARCTRARSFFCGWYLRKEFFLFSNFTPSEFFPLIFSIYKWRNHQVVVI